MRTDVLIVGAGPCGLALALWLTRLGIPVRIIDRAERPGAGARAFAVQARTLEFYDRLGLARDAVIQGRAVDQLTLHDEGRHRAVRLGDFGRGVSPFPFVLILLQDEHERLLIDQLAAAGVQVERGLELVDIDDTGSFARARLRNGHGDRIYEAKYICGCDGAGSIVRQLLDIAFVGRSSPELFYVADVEATGPLADGELHYVVRGEDQCSVFPRRGRGRLRLIGMAPRSVRELMSQFTFDDLRPQVERDTGLEIVSVDSFAFYPVHQRTAERWRRGRVFLLGDAAHVHSPAGGQGLNAGVGDAINLAWKLGAVLQGGADPSLLDTYEAERKSAARQVGASADRGFQLQAQGRVSGALLRLLGAWAVPSLMGLAVFGRWVFRTVSQVNVNYRDAGTCRGRAGRIQGGDRLPWVKPVGGLANFSALRPPFPLESLQSQKVQPAERAAVFDPVAGAYRIMERPLGFGWQIQVYGRSGPRLREACAEWGLDLMDLAWSPQAAGAGLARDGVYLVRPDGYVGYASRSQSVRPIAAYLQRFDIRFRSTPETGGTLHGGLGVPEARD